MKATPRQKHSIYLKKQNKQTPTTEIFKTQGKKTDFHKGISIRQKSWLFIRKRPKTSVLRENVEQSQVLYLVKWPFLWNEMLVSHLCLTLFDPMDYSLPGSSVHGILQARILERVAISFSRGSSWPRDWTWVSCITGRFFTVWVTREPP